MAQQNHKHTFSMTYSHPMYQVRSHSCNRQAQKQFMEIFVM